LPDILVTRPEPGASETAARLTALGFCPVLAPAMAVLPRHVGVDIRPQAVLATSGNAIAALPRSLHTVPMLAVGDATATRARAAGFATVHSAGRDAAALAELAAARCTQSAGPLLLASGEGQGMALAEALRAQGFRVVRRVAYATRAADTLPEDARAALAAGTIRAALFFSPQSARVFVTILQRDIPTLSVQGIDALAISRPTEAALKGLPWLRVRVASHPNQEELLKLLP
jgi:uroporphyrinogen-III synthase